MNNPNDEIRANLLQYFYDRNSTATSKYGKKGSAVKIRDLKKAMKSIYGLKQQEVVSNLNYLIDRGWVKSLDIKKQYQLEVGQFLL